MKSLKNLNLGSLLIVVLLLFANAVSADPTDSTATDENPVATTINIPQGSVTLKPEPVVTAAYSNNRQSTNQIMLGEELVLRVKHIETLVKQAETLGKDLVLYINNIPVKDAEYNYESQGLSFLLGNTGDVIDIWDHLLKTRGRGEFFKKEVTISVGIDAPDFRPIHTEVSEHNQKGFTIILIQKSWFWLSILMILTLIGAFVALAIRTDMLRDHGPAPASGRKPFSLGRTQMGIWSVAIISSWLFLYVCLHHFNLFTESTLILLGIASATGVGGFAMDTTRSKNAVLQSEGFFKDLVDDSLFRFQNIMWTVILVIVFVRSVLVYLEMPEFDEKLLMLMGISSGTYLGAKVTEPVPAPTVQDPPADPSPAPPTDPPAPVENTGDPANTSNPA